MFYRFQRRFWAVFILVHCFQAEAVPKVPGRPTALQEKQGSAREANYGRQFQRKLARHTRAGRASFFRRFLPLRDGKRAFAERIAMVNRSREFVVATVYSINPDQYGFAFVESLVAAAKRGLSVTLLLDRNAQLAHDLRVDKAQKRRMRSLFKELQDVGGTLAFAGGWKMLWKRPGAGKHTKVLISDGRQAIYEGRNIGEDYVEKWSDFGALLEGPVVGDLAREALHLLNTSDPYRWHGLRSRRKDRQRYAVKLSQLGRLIETSSVLRSSRLNNSAHKPAYFAAWDPLGDERTFIPQGTNRVTRALVDAIDQAQKTITLSTNFFFPSWGLRKKLKRAAQRGVQVNIVTTGKGHGPGYNLGRWIVSLFSRDLHKAGCRFFETRKKEHGKLYLFDEELAAFGSYNTSMMSHALNADSLLFSVESQVVNSVREALNESIDQSVLRD